MVSALVLFVGLMAPAALYAHGDHDHGHEENLEATLEHYAKIIELAPAVMADTSSSTARVRIDGVDVPMNGPFWELVRGWVRLYYKNLQAECDGCVPYREEQFTQRAEDQAARSFLNIKVTEPVKEAVEHLAVGTVDIGSQLGTTAAVAKLAAEVAETGVSKFVGGGGVHLVCHILDAIILFGTRHVQTASRLYAWTPAFDGSRTATMIKMGYVSSIIRKAQNRVRFSLKPVEVDEHELEEVDEEGPNRWWGWISEGKRSRWLGKLSAAEGEELKLKRKNYLGQRLKRYLWLKGRKRGTADFMRGNGGMDKSLNKSVLWILAVQEGMIERAFLPKGDEHKVADQSLASVLAAPEDEIRRGLAEEASVNYRQLQHTTNGLNFQATPQQIDLLEGLLKDVEVIFNPDAPMKIRYFHAATLEAVMAGFLYNRFSQVLAAAGEDYGKTAGMWAQLRLHWRAGRVGSYIYEWSDFLKLAALQTDRDVLAQKKYEAMESLVRILRHFKKSSELTKIETVKQLLKTEQTLMNDRKNLTTFTPWKEKSIERSWLPWRSPVPHCEEMNAL